MEHAPSRLRPPFWFRTTSMLVLLIPLAGCQQAERIYQSTTDSGVESKCHELSANEIEELKRNYPRDYLFFKIQSFYSKALSSCIFTEVPEPDAAAEFVEYNIYELSH